MNEQICHSEPRRRRGIRNARGFFVRDSSRSAALGMTVWLVLILFAAQSALACPVCFGNPDSPMTKGTSKAVWFLLGTIGFVQIGFVALFISFWRRARANRKFREQFHLIEGGTR